MSMQGWIGAVSICLALAGCCTDGTLCTTAPTSGPTMAWDGAGGQPPDQDVPPAKRKRRPSNEIVVGPLQSAEPDRAARASVANKPAANKPAASSSAAERADEAAVAETQLKQKLLICRGCL